MPRRPRLPIPLRLLTGCVLIISACTRSSEGATFGAFEVVAEWPHDSLAYTQGLVLSDGVLFESTGRYGRSDLRKVDPRSGRVIASVRLPDNRFGEGLALLDGRLYQLTWESGVGYIFDAKTLARVDSFTYAGEGWGLATDGARLFLSDGSDSLRVLSPRTFDVERVIHVRHSGSPLKKLNELEYVDGELLANVYESDWIARIDPATGEVLQLIDFAPLYPPDKRGPSTDVMNGIARAPQSGNLYVTGKLWPKLYEVRLRRTPTR
jgi:glutaminyl-peptide cyclotransferase